MSALPGMEGDFAKGASGPGNVYDTSPTGLGISPAYLATGATATANAVVAAEQAYNEFTAAVTITATTEGTANTVVTASAVSFDGSTPSLVEFFCPSVTNPAGAALTICLYEDGSSIGQLAFDFGSASVSVQVPVQVSRRLTPSAGSHTFSVRAFVASGTGTVNAGTGGSGNVLPGFIRITTAS